VKLDTIFLVNLDTPVSDGSTRNSPRRHVQPLKGYHRLSWQHQSGKGVSTLLYYFGDSVLFCLLLFHIFAMALHLENGAARGGISSMHKGSEDVFFSFIVTTLSIPI
jgi:hypothetical protein